LKDGDVVTGEKDCHFFREGKCACLAKGFLSYKNAVYWGEALQKRLVRFSEQQADCK
jgi:hypothetical protein